MVKKPDMSVFAEEILKLRKDGDLSLTVFGAVTLSPFSKRIILKARDKFRQVRGRVSTMDKPFNYFLATCMELARDLQDTPDWGIATNLGIKFKLSGAVRVTEDNEFLLESPNTVKKTIDALSNRRKNPYKREETKPSTKFDGKTYTKKGVTYLKPTDKDDFMSSEAAKRLNKEPTYWDNEKRKFLELARDGKVNEKGLQFLVDAGLLTQEEIKKD